MSGPYEEAAEEADGTVNVTDVLLIVAIAIAMVPVLKLLDAIHWVIDSR